MSPYYDQPRHRESEDIAGGLVLLSCAVVAFVWYFAVSMLHLHNSQCLEIFLYSAVALLGGGLVFGQLVGRRKRREENWPHPALLIRASKDAAIVEEAYRNGATLLGYNVHKEPWVWPDAVRMKHGVIVGGTGAGKSTFLENIIAQDVMRRLPAIQHACSPKQQNSAANSGPIGRSHLPSVADAFLQLDLPGLHEGRVALFGDFDRCMAEQQ